MTEPQEVIVARMDVRLGAVERDIRDIKNDVSSRRPSWPSVASSLVSVATLLVVLIQTI